MMFMNLNGNIGGQTKIRIWRKISLSADICTVSQMLWILGEHGYIPYSRSLNFVVNYLDLCFTGLILFYWYKLAFVSCFHVLPRSRKLNIIVNIPISFLIICNLLSAKTHWVFYIDDAGRYTRGDLYFIQIICSYIYFFFAFIIYIYSYHRAPAAEKKFQGKLIFFSVVPVICGIMQIYDIKFPYAIAAIHGGILFFYISILNNRIKTDAMTTLNNRACCDMKIEERIKESNSFPFYLYLLDINDFKHINDTYGHNSGDLALVIVSEALKETAYKFNGFIGRYGGDEFLAIIDKKNIAFPHRFHQDVNEQIALKMAQNNVNFPISIATGCSLCYSNKISKHDLVKKADKMLYQTKKTMKNKHLRATGSKKA